MVHYLGLAYYVHLKGHLILKWEAILSSETLAPVGTPYNVASQLRRQRFIIPSYWCLNQDSTTDRAGTCSSSVCPRTQRMPFKVLRYFTQTPPVFEGVFNYMTFNCIRSSYNKSQRDALFLNLILVKNSTSF